MELFGWHRVRVGQIRSKAWLLWWGSGRRLELDMKGGVIIRGGVMVKGEVSA